MVAMPAIREVGEGVVIGKGSGDWGMIRGGDMGRVVSLTGTWRGAGAGGGGVMTGGGRTTSGSGIQTYSVGE